MRVGLRPSPVRKYQRVVRAVAKGTGRAAGSSRCTRPSFHNCFFMFLKEASYEFSVKSSDFEMLASSSPSFSTLSIHTVPAKSHHLWGRFNRRPRRGCCLPLPGENLPRERERMEGAGGFPEAPCVNHLVLASVLEGC